MWQHPPKMYRTTWILTLLSHPTQNGYHKLTNTVLCESWATRTWRQGYLQVGIIPSSGSSMLSASHHCVLAQEQLPILPKKSGPNSRWKCFLRDAQDYTHHIHSAHLQEPSCISFHTRDTGVADQSVSPDHAMRCPSPTTSRETALQLQAMRLFAE